MIDVTEYNGPHTKEMIFEAIIPFLTDREQYADLVDVSIGYDGKLTPFGYLLSEDQRNYLIDIECNDHSISDIIETLAEENMLEKIRRNWKDVYITLNELLLHTSNPDLSKRKIVAHIVRAAYNWGFDPTRILVALRDA